MKLHLSILFKQMVHLISLIDRLTTPNGQFGVMAAVTPRTILCGNERLYPAGSSVEAATTPSRWDVVCNVGQSAADNKVKH